MSPKPRESKATEGRCGEPGRVFRLPGGVGSARLMLAVHLGEVRFSRVTAELAPYLAARGFAVARSRAHVERQAKSAAPAAATWRPVTSNASGGTCGGPMAL